MHTPFHPTKTKKFLIKMAIAFLVALGLVFLTGCSVPFIPKKQEPELPTEPFTQAEIDAVLKDIGKLIQIPENDTPLVATITDAEKLRAEQEFYEDVQNGDVLVIFSQDARAVIYRPSDNILVNVGPIFVDNEVDNQ